MPLKNRYYKCSKISERKFREIIRYFARDLTASDASRLSSVSIKSINNIYLKLRKRIVQECEQQDPLSGIIEVDESYFGPHRIRGKRGRGAGGKTIVFGIFKGGDKVYTEIVPDASKASLVRVIRGHVSINSIIHTDGWRGYNGLVDVGFAKHFRVRHGENEFAKGNQHINGIESFWSYAKRRLVKFNGAPGVTFSCTLKKLNFALITAIKICIKYY